MNQESLLDSPPKIEQTNNLKKTKTESKTQSILKWCFGILFVGFLIFLNFYFKNFYIELYNITERVMKEKSIMTYIRIFIIMILLQMLFIPGISFFIIYISYVCKDYWYSISLVVPSSYAVASLSYLITRYTVRDWIHNKLSQNIYFRRQ